MKLRTIFVAAVAAMLTALSVNADEPFRNHRYDSFKAGRVTPQSIVFVGNSITNMGCWAETFGDDVRCLNRGNSGAVSSETLENIESAIYGHPAKVFIMIGTNDLGTNYAETIPFNNVKAMIARIQDESPNTDIYITSVFPSTVGTRTLEGEASLNERYKTLVDNKKVFYLDLYDDLMCITTGEISLDKLHMNPKGYKIWCDAVVNVANDETLKSSLIDKDLMNVPTCGQSSSNGMRNQMFCELPSYSNDVWIMGDEMVNGGEWQELFGLTNVKNRGYNWGFGGIPITSYTAALPIMLTNNSDKMSKEAPKQIFFYVGTSELSSNTSASTVKSRYRSLIKTAQESAPNTKLYILGLTPHWTTSTNTLVQSYNTEFKALAEETGVTYIDLFTPLANANGTPNAVYLPTQYVWGKGYNKIAQILAEYIDDANVLTDEEFDAQYATINARNTLGKAVTSAKEIVVLETVSAEYKARLQEGIDSANALLQSSSLNADEFTEKAEDLATLASVVQALASGGSDYKATLKQQLADIEQALADKNIGNDYGQYSVTYEGWDADINALREMLADNSDSYDEFECALLVLRLQNALENVSINMPKPGSYIRVKASKGYINNKSYTSTFNGVQNYLSSTCKENTVNSGTDWQAISVNSKEGENEATTIFYYAPLEGSEYGNLISYDQGRYAYTGVGNMLGFHQGSAATNAASATIVGFQAALAEEGAYHFRYNIQGSAIESARVLCITGNDLVVNGGQATAATLKSYIWSDVELEAVTSLPVTIGNDGSAEFSVPVAVTVPKADAEFFVATYANSILTLHQVAAGETLAAGTAFYISGAAGTTVRFEIADTNVTANDAYVCGSVHSSPALNAFTSTSGITSFAKTSAASSNAAALHANSANTSITLAALNDGEDVIANASVIDVPTSVLANELKSAITIALTNDGNGGDKQYDLSTYSGVMEVVIDRLDGSTTIYDLQGRRVNNPTHGIYIVNGKTVRK